MALDGTVYCLWWSVHLRKCDYQCTLLHDDILLWIIPTKFLLPDILYWTCLSFGWGYCMVGLARMLFHSTFAVEYYCMGGNVLVVDVSNGPHGRLNTKNNKSMNNVAGCNTTLNVKLVHCEPLNHSIETPQYRGAPSAFCKVGVQEDIPHSLLSCSVEYGWPFLWENLCLQRYGFNLFLPCCSQRLSLSERGAQCQHQFGSNKFPPNMHSGVLWDGIETWGHWPWPSRSFWPFPLRIRGNLACPCNNSSQMSA